MFNENHTSEHNFFMAKAFKQAELAYEEGEVPVGAVVVHKNRIIGRGYNQTEKLNDPTAHAELVAISSACATIENKYLTDCTLYVTLEPCMMCAGALVWSKISTVVFGAIDENAGGCGSLFNIVQNQNLNHRVEVIQGVMEQDCSFLLKSFFNEKRKK